MSKPEIADAKESVFKEIINILEGQGVAFTDSTDTRVVGVRKHDIRDMVNRLSTFANSGHELALQTGLNPLEKLWEDTNLSDPVKQEMIEVINKFINKSTSIDRANLLKRGMQKLLKGKDFDSDFDSDSDSDSDDHDHKEDLLYKAVETVEIEEVVKVLENFPDIDVNYFGGSRKSGRYTLELAVVYGSYEIAKKLIEHGANVNSHNGSDNSEDSSFPLDVAYRQENLEMVNLLIQSGADLDSSEDNKSFIEKSKEYQRAQQTFEATANLIYNVCHNHPIEFFDNYENILKQSKYYNTSCDTQFSKTLVNTLVKKYSIDEGEAEQMIESVINNIPKQDKDIKVGIQNIDLQGIADNLPLLMQPSPSSSTPPPHRKPLTKNPSNER